MNDLMKMLFYHLVCIAQWGAFLMVHYCYLGKGRVKHPLWWSVPLIAAMTVFSMTCGWGFFTFKSIMANVAFLVLSSLIFGGSWVQKLMSCLISGVMCLLTENTVLYTFAWCTHMRPHDVWKDPFCILTFIVVILLAGGVVSHYIRQWKKKQALEPLQVLVAAFFPCVVVVLNGVLMISGGGGTASWMSILLTLGLTVAVLVHLLIVDILNEQVVERRNSQFQAELEEERAEALLDSYTTQRRLTHEFTNQMDALSLLLEQGDLEGAKAYLHTVSRTVQTSTTILNTHNPLLDALLSKKYEEAGRQGVMMYFDLSDLRQLPLTQNDLVIIVSNLLNNAIEAAAQTDRPEVHVRIKRTEGEILLSVRNRVAKDIDLSDGQLPRSTKKEFGHGMGLPNVRDTLARYHGEYTLSCRDHWFRVTCSVPTAEAEKVIRADCNS